MNDGAKRERTADIDGLRAVAFLSVLVMHAASYAPWVQMIGPDRAAAFLDFRAAPYTIFGSGVDLFFVLSGFCLSYPFLDALRLEGSARFDLPVFFARRVVRIFPPFAVALAIFIGLTSYLQRLGVALPRCFGGDLSELTILQNLFFLDRNVEWIDGSFWTLALEARWYLVFPIALALYTWAPRLMVCLAIASAAAYNATALHSVDVGFIGLFVAGIAVADCRVRSIRTPRLALASMAFGLLLGCFALPLYVHGYSQANPGWQLFYLGVALAANSFERFKRVLRWKPLVVVGVASYSLYLIHEPVLAIVESGAIFRAAPMVLIVTGLGASIACGFAFWFSIERHWQGTAFSRGASVRIGEVLARYCAALHLPGGGVVRLIEAGFERNAIESAVGDPRTTRRRDSLERRMVNSYRKRAEG